MAHQPTTTHEEFAANWSPARGATDRQTTKVNGWEPVTRDEESDDWHGRHRHRTIIRTDTYQGV